MGAQSDQVQDGMDDRTDLDGNRNSSSNIIIIIDEHLNKGKSTNTDMNRNEIDGQERQGREEPEQNKQRRRVHFPCDDTVLTTVVANLPNVDDLSPQEKQDVWFGKPDFDRFRATGREIARQARRSGYGVLLNLTTQRPETLRATIRQWVRFGHSRRGLEMQVDQKHAAIRRRWRSAAVKAVLATQDALKPFQVPDAVKQAKLALVYTKRTMRARRYATIIGMEDADVVLNEEAGVPIEDRDGRSYNNRIIVSSSSSSSSSSGSTAMHVRESRGNMGHPLDGINENDDETPNEDDENERDGEKNSHFRGCTSNCEDGSINNMNKSNNNNNRNKSDDDIEKFGKMENSIARVTIDEHDGLPRSGCNRAA